MQTDTRGSAFIICSHSKIHVGQSGGAAPAAGNAAASGYAVGERVEHPKFGCGEIVRIETLAADHKLVVVFEEYGEKTLLAKFAKLTKR